MKTNWNQPIFLFLGQILLDRLSSSTTRTNALKLERGLMSKLLHYPVHVSIFKQRKPLKETWPGRGRRCGEWWFNGLMVPVPHAPWLCRFSHTFERAFRATFFRPHTLFWLPGWVGERKQLKVCSAALALTSLFSISSYIFRPISLSLQFLFNDAIGTGT